MGLKRDLDVGGLPTSHALALSLVLWPPERLLAASRSASTRISRGGLSRTGTCSTYARPDGFWMSPVSSAIGLSLPPPPCTTSATVPTSVSLIGSHASPYFFFFAALPSVTIFLTACQRLALVTAIQTLLPGGEPSLISEACLRSFLSLSLRPFGGSCRRSRSNL